MEEPSSGGASPSRDSDNSVDPGMGNPSIAASLDEILADVTSKASLSSLRTPPAKKAKRVRFFRNGDKFYTGVVFAVTPERYRNFDSLASDLTRALATSVTLPNGVRSIYAMDGKKVQTVGDLEDGKCYVVSGQGEIFKKVEYSSTKVRRGSSLTGLPQSPAGAARQISSIPSCVRARIVTLVRNGSKPRRVARLLLNKRNSPSFEHVFEAITEAVKLDSGAVRRVYTIAGKPVVTLEQFFENEEIFVAYGTEKSSQEDFELDGEESRSVQSFRRGPWISRRQAGPMPVMPRKSGKRILAAPQVRTPSPASLALPQPLRIEYAVGHVIGDGNFAVVRHCIHKATGAEYAMKIVDKYKCQGKETMLASEVAILRQVCHPNIISLIGEQETVDQLFLVMELVKGGDLFDAIAAATKFSEAEASVMIGHLTSALAYLHSHQIVHRDVKPENLLVELDGSKVQCLKLGDFGLAQVVRGPLYTVCGTPTYVAPEILAETGYELKIDVWAAGVILYILLCGFPPFVSLENDQEELFERILSGEYEFPSPYWDTVSVTAKQLISNMLQAQPELRFSAEDVLDHPWLVRFPGVNQTVSGGGGEAYKSSKQHGDQQCQPLRLATFEFDYKKQRRHEAAIVVGGGGGGGGGDENSTSRETKDRQTSKKWLDPSKIKNETFGNCKSSKLTSEINDNENGNNRNSDQEPLSLSADCLRDIRDFTSSLHDLVINIDVKRRESNDQETNDKRIIMKNSSSENLASFVSREMKNFPEKSTKNEDKESLKDRESPLASNEHSANHKNANSRRKISSGTRTTASANFNDSGLIVNEQRHCDTPKNDKSGTRERYGRSRPRNLCKIENFTRKNSNECNSTIEQHQQQQPRHRPDETARNFSLDRASNSTDRTASQCSVIDDKNIETSDSFVNIKFAKRTRRDDESISSHSVKSSESIDDTRSTDVFSIIDDGKNLQNMKNNDDALDRRMIGKALISEKLSNKKDETSTRLGGWNNNYHRTGQNYDCNITKLTRQSLIPIQYNGNSKNCVKNIEKSRIPINNGVKLRDKKNLTGPTTKATKTSATTTTSQAKSNDTRNKRFSCFSAYSGRTYDTKTEVKSTGDDVASMENMRKCSSSDELYDETREEKRKTSETRAKRFSLYYTPQPARKIYENESVRRQRIIRVTAENSSARPTSRRTQETSDKIIEENSRIVETRDSTKNRRTVVETTTVASRNKSMRQDIRARMENINLPPGRTK